MSTPPAPAPALGPILGTSERLHAALALLRQDLMEEMKQAAGYRELLERIERICNERHPNISQIQGELLRFRLRIGI